MLWEGRRLRDIREADVRLLVESGLEEHLQLEYKSALYDDNDRGRREFLLDACMFANAAGGVILVGIPEQRDQEGQPTGAPDRQGALGLELPNPEGILNAYDARVMEAIEERLPLESAAVDVGNNRRVLAIRVPNSTRKPHSVRHQGHIYFPSRRERQRYHMNVREIKELVMRTASRVQMAEEALKSALLGVTRPNDLPYLIIGVIPVFFEDFLVDVTHVAVRRAVGNFSRTEPPLYREPDYMFEGLERREQQFDYLVRFCRNGLLMTSNQLPLYQGRAQGEDLHAFVITAIDAQLRRFVSRASGIYDAAAITAPYILGMALRTHRPLAGVYGGYANIPQHTEPIPTRDYWFPFMQVDDLSQIDRVIRPFCDQAHQTFGRPASPSFNADGVWTANY